MFCICYIFQVPHQDLVFFGKVGFFAKRNRILIINFLTNETSMISIELRQKFSERKIYEQKKLSQGFELLQSGI